MSTVITDAHLDSHQKWHLPTIMLLSTKAGTVPRLTTQPPQCVVSLFSVKYLLPMARTNTTTNAEDTIFNNIYLTCQLSQPFPAEPSLDSLLPLIHTWASYDGPVLILPWMAHFFCSENNTPVAAQTVKHTLLSLTATWADSNLS